MSVKTLCTRWGPFINLCYVLVDDATGEAALVDPAWEVETIEAAVERDGLCVKHILLTHTHFDHTNLAERCAERWEAPIVMSRDEYREGRFFAPQLRLVDEGDRIPLGREQIDCLITPGHTEGSTCYLWGGGIFTGDTLFPEGCGICPNDGAAGQMFDSIQRIKSLIPAQTRLFAGHRLYRSGGLTLQEAGRYNIYLQIEDRELFQRFRMRPGQPSAMAFRDLSGDQA